MCAGWPCSGGCDGEPSATNGAGNNETHQGLEGVLTVASYTEAGGAEDRERVRSGEPIERDVCI